GLHPPAGRATPPFVMIRAAEPRSARATSASLPSYARAVSKIVTPAARAARIGSSDSRRMQPRPMRSAPSGHKVVVGRLVLREPGLGDALLGARQPRVDDEVAELVARHPREIRNPHEDRGVALEVRRREVDATGGEQQLLL